MKNFKKSIYIIIIGIVLAVIFSGCINENVKTQLNIFGKDSKELEVHFIDVGQGDSILIKCNDEAMMVDFADNSKGTLVQKYLMDQDVSELKYAIGTHPDTDHIGGMDVILYKFNTDMVLMPPVETNTHTYADVVEVCKQKGYKINNPELGDVYEIGDASFQIIAPCGGGYDNVNSFSIGIKLTYGDNSFILCGDATIESEKEMLESGMDLSADVLKLSHHGSRTSTSQEFFNAVNPKYSVISCAIDNEYGHPHAAVMNILKESNSKLFRTDLQGTIIAYSDGKNISWNVKPTTEYITGTKIRDNNDNQQVTEFQEFEEQTGTVYIINTNTKKIHLPGCSSVEDIKPENKEESRLSLEELKEQGYTACKKCIDNK